MPRSASCSVPTAGTDVQGHSAALRKELGLFDLVMAQLLIIIVPDFIGTAVKAGTAHVFFWIIGTVFFFIPLAAVVIHMNRRLPLEGGLYEWVRIAFNDQLGFLVAWNVWMFAISYVGIAGFVTVGFASYALPEAAWIASSKPTLALVSVAVIFVTMGVAAFGLRLGKWVTNVSTLAFLLIVALLIFSPWLHMWRGSLKEYHPLSVVIPPLTLFSVSVFSKMTFGALCSFEYVAALAGECRNPRQDLPRSVLVAAPIITLVYILVTSAVRAFVPASAEDLVAPMAQALSRGGAQAYGVHGIVLPAAIGGLFVNYIATFCIMFGVCTRLPMVAGWDHLLPAWFSRLHPRYKTPLNSILILGAATLLFGIASSIGVSIDEAYELLLMCSFTFYALAYLALFAIPLFSPKQRGLRAGPWVKLAACSGFLSSLLYVILAVVPVMDLHDSSSYAMKIAVAVISTNLVAVIYYRTIGRKSASRAKFAESRADSR